MGASESFEKSHLQSSAAAIQQKPSKSCCSNVLCKSLLIVFVLVLIPLFPSQAPDFINQSSLTRFWELLHLLFVGIAVCYGLFCRKSMELETQNHPGNDTSHAVFAGGLSFPSFFEDGFENLCISDDYNESLYVDYGKKLTSFHSRNESANACENGSEKEPQIWNLQYFKGENFVVVNDGNYDVSNEHKPLGLPIRSLRSGTAEVPKITTRNGETSSLKFSISDDNKGKVERYRGLVPNNLEKKFEGVAGTSAIPWRSRSGRRMELKEEVSNAGSQSRCRPHSVGEFEFEHLQSEEFQHPVSSCSKSSNSSSPRVPISSSSVSSEASKLRTENHETVKDCEGSFDSALKPMVAKLHVGASFTSSKYKGSSIRAYSEMEMSQRSKDGSLNWKKNTGQDQLGDANRRGGSLELNVKTSNSFENTEQLQLGGNKQRSDCSDTTVKSPNLTKILSSAKSVRTLRSGDYVSDKLKRAENSLHQTEDYGGGTFSQFEASASSSLEKKGEPINRRVDKQQRKSDKVYPLPKSTVSLNQIEEMQEIAEGALLSEDDSVSESASHDFHGDLSENEAGLGAVDDEELVGSEVDRKADEFIAKFREQIRLQKMASARKC